MHKLMRYIKGYEKQALLAPLFKMLEACFELFVPLVIAQHHRHGHQKRGCSLHLDALRPAGPAGCYRLGQQP